MDWTIKPIQIIGYRDFEIQLVRSKNNKGFKAIVVDAALRRHYFTEIYKTPKPAFGDAEDWIDNYSRNLPRKL